MGLSDPNTSSYEPISRRIHVNGVELNLLDWGGQGEPILILHATGFLGRIYKPVADALKSIGHVYSYDQRGQGDSPHQEGTVYSWENTIGDLESVIAYMGWSNIRGVGHSAGATAIGCLSAKNPYLFSRSVLIDPVISLKFYANSEDQQTDIRALKMRERALKRRTNFDSIEHMFAEYKEKPPFNTWQSDILLDYCKYGTRELAEGRRVLKCLPFVEATIYDTGRFFDGLSCILKSKAPLLFMFSQKSPLFVACAPIISQTLPQAKIEISSKLGHLMPMEDPDYVIEHALRFLAG